ncbi:MAG: cation:proton antiporter [Steroidobacteraceae bacterium]
MPQETTLISTLAVSLAFAVLGGMLASRLKLPPLVGYLLAGIAVGPFTPGFVADRQLAPQLAEIGVMLLMFGVGMHFSLRELWEARAVALPGAVAQIAVASALGWGLGCYWGWDLAAGLVFGLALSVASTVVLLRALESRDMLETSAGKITVGWLIVEDLAMVFVLVVLPTLAAPQAQDALLGAALAITLGKVAGFVALMLLLGARALPWLLAWVERTGSRELFTVTVVAIALGLAYGAHQLGLSYALGAFFAGIIIHQSDLSQRAARDLMPLQDCFAALFFVSVGMLFDPAVLVRSPWRIAAVVGIVMIGKSLAAAGIVALLGRSGRTAALVSAALAQIGEFSFILAALGVSLGILPAEGRDLILAAALISIALNPLMFNLAGRLRGAAGATLTAGLVLVALPCADALAASPAGRIHVVGSSTLFPFATVVAEHVARRGRWQPAVVESTGTGGGFKMFCNGARSDAPDITDASRPMTDGEWARCRDGHIGPLLTVRVGSDGIIIASSIRAAPLYLTREQLYRATAANLVVGGAFTANPHRRWSQIDQRLADRPIRIYGPAPNHGTRDAFAALVMSPPCERQLAVKSLGPEQRQLRCQQVREDGAWIDVAGDYGIIMDRLIKDPGAVAVLPFSFLDQHRDLIQGASIDGVMPTVENIGAAAYPLSRPLFLYVNRSRAPWVPGLSEFVQEFLSDRAAGPQGYLVDKGLAPLPAGLLAAERAKALALLPAHVP